MKKIFLGLILILGINSFVFAQTLLINNKEIEEGTTLNLFFDDLDQGKIFFSLRAYKLSKVEITFDQGRTWQAMGKEKDYFIFGYRPLQEEELRPEFLLTEEGGAIRTYKPNVKIIYQKKRPDEAVLQVLDKMKLYYEQENIDRFIDLFSTNYPDRIKFKEAIQNDFYNYKNIRLRYRVDRKVFDTDFEGAIWDVYWERKYDDRQGTEFSDSANIAMRFDKEGPNWLISGMRGNTIFGSTLLGQSDLVISDADVDCVDFDGAHYLVITVHNQGAANASNVVVRVSRTYPSSCTVEKTINNIPSGSSEVANFNGVSCAYCITGISFTISIDPNNTIPESNETNNSVTKSF